MIVPEESPGEDFLDYIAEADPIRGVHAIYFSRKGAGDRTELYSARTGSRYAGYLFTYNAIEYGVTWAYMHCSAPQAAALADYIPDGRVLASMGEDTLGIISERRKPEAVRKEIIMVVRRGAVNLPDSSLPVILGPQHAERFSMLTGIGSSPGNNVLESTRKFLSEEVVYGVFARDGTLASVAGTNARSEKVWVLSSIETSGKYRKKGYASIVLSSLLRDALKNAETAALFVDPGNAAVISMYEKLGFRKECESVQAVFESGVDGHGS